MGRIKSVVEFGQRNYVSETKDPYKIIVLSVEGNRTEFDYFSYFADDSKILGINSLIKIRLLEREDTKSSPQWVKKLLDEYITDYGLSENDILWMIIDRDAQNNSKKQLIELIEECNEENILISISNPCFELWLLLHCITDLNSYDKNILLSNPKPRAKANKRYIEIELKRINGTYNKKKLAKNDFISFEKISNAIRLEKDLEQIPINIIDNLGSNIGQIVERIMNNDV